MKIVAVACLVSLGGLIESFQSYGGQAHTSAWAITCVITGLVWSGTSISSVIAQARTRIIQAFTGHSQPMPATDPKALAAEIAALNAQIAQLRDTATSFDVSFDNTLERLDERLRRVEQQTPYVNIGQQR